MSGAKPEIQTGSRVRFLEVVSNLRGERRDVGEEAVVSYRFGDEVGVHWPGGVLFCIPVERLEAVCAKVAP